MAPRRIDVGLVADRQQDVSERVELRHLEVEGGRELLVPSRGGAERLGDAQTALDLVQGLFPPVDANPLVHDEGAPAARRGDSARVRFLLARRPEQKTGSPRDNFA